MPGILSNYNCLLILSLLLVFVVATFLYLNTLGNSFVWDDVFIVEYNPRIKDWDQLGKIFTGDFFPQKEERSGFYRPVTTLSFVADHSIWGLNPAGYHLSNVLLHSVASALVFFLGYAILESVLGAVFVSLLFALHPVHTESVAWISGRTDILAAIFFLSALLAFIRSQKVVEPLRREYRGHLFYSLCVVLFALALLSKEVAITFPLIAALYDWYYISEGDVRLFKRNFIRRYTPLVTTAAAYVFLHLYLIGDRAMERGYDYPENPILAFIETLQIFAHYVKILILPLWLDAEIHIFPPESLLQITNLVSIAVTAAVIYAGIMTLRSGRTTKRARDVSFGIFWFLCLFPFISGIIPSWELIAERFLYIPSLGFCIALGAILESAISGRSVERPLQAEHPQQILSFNIAKSIASIAFLCLICSYSVIVIRRNKDWKNDYTIFSKSLENPKNSDNSRLHYNMASAYINIKGSLTDAILELEKAVSLDFPEKKAFRVLGKAYLIKGRTHDAIGVLRKALDVDPHKHDIYNGLGGAYFVNGMIEEAISNYKEGVRENPDYDELQYNLANVYVYVDSLDKAVFHYTEALRINSDYANAHNNLGNVYLIKGKIERAIFHFKEALRIYPDHEMAHYNLGDAYSGSGATEEAIRHYMRAISLDSTYTRAHNALGKAYVIRGMPQDGIEHYKEAIKIDSNFADAHYNLGLTYHDLGQAYDRAMFHMREGLRLQPDHVLSDRAREIVENHEEHIHVPKR